MHFQLSTFNNLIYNFFIRWTVCQIFHSSIVLRPSIFILFKWSSSLSLFLCLKMVQCFPSSPSVYQHVSFLCFNYLYHCILLWCASRDSFVHLVSLSFCPFLSSFLNHLFFDFLRRRFRDLWSLASNSNESFSQPFDKWKQNKNWPD